MEQQQSCVAQLHGITFHSHAAAAVAGHVCTMHGITSHAHYVHSAFQVLQQSEVCFCRSAAHTCQLIMVCISGQHQLGTPQPCIMMHVVFLRWATQTLLLYGAAG
jgi:hypothetical protein